MKKYNRKSSGQALENLESRELLSSTLLSGGSLELRGDTNQSNTFLVRSASADRVMGYANNFGEVAAVNQVQQVVIYLGKQDDTVTVAAGVNTPVEVITANGQTTWMKAGQTQKFDGTPSHGNAVLPTGPSGSSSSGSGSTTGGSSSGGSSNSGSGSSGSSHSGSSSSGTSKSGSSSSGSSSSGTSHSGTSNSGSSSSGSSNSGSSSSGSSSGSSSSGTSNSGSSSSGSSNSGSSTSGSSNSGSGSSGSGSNSNGPTPTPTPPSSSTPDAVITRTTTGTILPLETVNVQAVNSTFGSGTVLNSKITWNFGDPNSQYNNDLVGYNAAHAYTAPGTYTITMTITTPDGHVGVATTQVTIAPDSRQTIYVSTSGNDANNGLSASDPIQSMARLQQLLTSNTRVLFQAGDTFTLNTTSEISLAGMSHVYLGSYGSGAQPILYYNGPAGGGSFIGFSNSTSGVVIQGLTFDSIYTNNDNKQAIPMALIPTGSDISILNNTFLNVGEDVNLQLAPSNVLVQNNSSPGLTDLSGYFGWVAGTDVVFLGNTVAASTGEAIMRVAGVTDLELAYNNWTNPSETAGGDVSKNVLSTQVGQYIYVYKNTFALGPVNAGPLGTSVANPNVQISDVVFDSNVVNGTTILLTAGVNDVMVENNVINGTGSAGITIDAQEVGGGFNWTASNIWIEHNTVTEPGQWGGFLYINDGQAANVTVDYNVFDDPNYQVGSGQAFISVDENNLGSFSQIMDNVWSIPASIPSWNNGGVFFVGTDPSSQTAWLTPAEFESTGVASGDVFENINLGSTYSVTADGFSAGSDLPTS